MNEIAIRQGLSGSLLEVIARAATDERVNIDKMTALLAMQERIMAKQALDEFNEAMTALNERCEMRVGKAGVASLGGKGSYRFAKWEDMDAVIRPAMRELGLRFSFDSHQTSDGKLKITGTLHHRGGHKEEASIYLPIDTGPGRNPLQQVGSTTSYGKRYCVELLLNVVREDEDDDGQAGGARAPRQPHSTVKTYQEPEDKPPLTAPIHERAAWELAREPNGTEWLKLLRAWVDACETASDVAEISALPSVVSGKKNAPSTINKIITEIFTDRMNDLAEITKAESTDESVETDEGKE